MAPEHYVSAEWIVDELTGERTIRAIGDDDSVWWIPSLDCDVPPWPEYLASADGRAFAASEPKEE